MVWDVVLFSLSEHQGTVNVTAVLGRALGEVGGGGGTEVQSLEIDSLL